LLAALARPASPITSLPAPPPGVPEYGIAAYGVVGSTQSPVTMQTRLARLRSHHPSLKRFPIAIATEPPSMATIQMATFQMAISVPVRLPAPQRPAVWLNQPYPVPLPEPGSIGPQFPESPTIAPPVDQQDEQNNRHGAALSGAPLLLHPDSQNPSLLYRTSTLPTLENSGWLSTAQPALNF